MENLTKSQETLMVLLVRRLRAQRHCGNTQLVSRCVFINEEIPDVRAKRSRSVLSIGQSDKYCHGSNCVGELYSSQNSDKLDLWEIGCHRSEIPNAVQRRWYTLANGEALKGLHSL